MSDEGKASPLDGLRVVDASTVIAGPTIGMLMGDFGADVIKVEHPRGDVLRNTGYQKDGVGLWFKMANRNKRCVTLNFGTEKGQEVFKKLIKTTDVLIENFRTGTMEKWGLGWEDLHAINPRLVMIRVTGYGQTGPYKNRPGFGTIAEAFSGFAAVTGTAIIVALGTTLPGAAAVMVPLAPDIGAATGLSLDAVLSAIMLGCSTPLLPYQAAPMVVALQLGAVSMAAGTRFALLIAAGTILVLLPLEILWLVAIGLL